jgi:Acetyltransferases
MNVVLRIVTADDIQFVERSVDASDAASFMSRTFPRSYPRYTGADDFTRWHLIVIEKNVAGTIWMERESDTSECCDLGILIFDSASRGCGLGAEAIKLAEHDAVVNWGIKLVRLRVRSSNERAMSCYRRCGYQVSATATKEIVGEAISVLHMEHRLSVALHETRRR